jgi:uncharacterized protein YceK
MRKRIMAFLIVLTFVFLVSGCGTIKGACEGFANEDWPALKKMDDWIRRNLW